MTWLRLTMLCGFALAGAARAEVEAPFDDGGTSKVYIVQLKAPAAVEYHASQAAAGAAKIGGGAAPAAFDKNAAGVRSYANRLVDQHDSVLTRLGPDPRKLYSYRYSLNGFAARMTQAEAAKLGQMPEVLHVWEDEVRPLATSFSADFLGLFEPEVGLRGATGLTGEDIVIGIIDSGIIPEHPALSDTLEADRPRACQSRWAETSLLGRWLCRRYDELEDTLVFQPPENWDGTCQAGPEFPADACNNKMIGARYFFEGAEATGRFDDGEIFSARDVDGHGTHTATTAAGNRVRASIFGTFLERVEGMAPRARVAAYKACWLRPGDLRASCNTSDLAHAIDAAVADGVHIINYSVGSSVLTATAPDDIALMAAAKAGVLTVVAAGNEGPGFNTIGSPAGAPWVITTGASSRDGEHSLEAIEVTAPASVSGRYAVREASFTPPLIDEDRIEGRLVLVDDDDDTLGDGTAGTEFDACEPLVNGAELSGNVAFIQRGGCDFEVKVENAEDAGAIAVLVFNIAGSPIVMTGSTDPGIPALMVGQADGNLLLAEIDAGEALEVILDKGLFLTEEETGNVMGAFSSRGPGPVQDILKPDVTAPGINILAGFTPVAANSVAGENFAFLTGTSMAAPHVAGIAALLREAHPDWSPAAIKSALMTTAYQGVTQQDGETAANPFDFGSGHIDPNRANDPGLVYDLTDDEYDAFACGTASPAVDEARCDQLAIDGFSFEAVDMNQPSIALSGLTRTQTVTRRVTNVSDGTGRYTAQVEAPAGISVLVSPSTLSLAPGASAEFEVTFGFESGPLDLWRFGSLTWVGDEHAVRSVLAVRPTSIRAPAEVASSGSTGSLAFPVAFGYTGTYAAGVHGLVPAIESGGSVDEDPNQEFTFRAGGGVSVHTLDLPADQAYLRFALFDEFTDGDDDLDMYVRYCPTLASCTKIAESGEPTSREQVNVLLPGPGRYEVFVHGFDTDDAGGAGANYTLFTWFFGRDDDRENMTVAAPGFVDAGTTSDITLNWSGLAAGGHYLGAISHRTPQGLVALTVVNIGVGPTQDPD
ncbi:MAG TPA: S8 family serine peptidase [Woeseiaceae bacterium]|nr:S8 family serine peptidase [Woeseiaceae bacterium]